MRGNIQKLINKYEVNGKYNPHLIRLAGSRRLEPGKSLDRDWKKMNLKGLVELEIEQQANLSEAWNQGNIHEF